MHGLVVDRPESVEAEGILVELDSSLHLQIGLVADYVVDLLELDGCQDAVELLLKVMGLETGQEDALVVFPLNESVSGVAIGFH